MWFSQELLDLPWYSSRAIALTPVPIAPTRTRKQLVPSLFNSYHGLNTRANEF